MASTIEGKKISAKNAIKHGILAEIQVLPDESYADFDVFSNGLRADPGVPRNRARKEKAAGGWSPLLDLAGAPSPPRHARRSGGRALQCADVVGNAREKITPHEKKLSLDATDN